MTSPLASSPPSARTAGMPGELVRTAISFVLFLHFFALAVAILSNWSPSTLASRMRNVPGLRQYLQFFDMDQAYIGLYNLHDGMSEDTDATVEVELKLAGGETRTFTLPEAGLRPGQRFRHFSRLAEVAADLASNQDLQSVVPQAIAKHYIAQLEASGQKLGGGTIGVIRVGHWLLQSMEATESSRAEERDPHSSVYYRKLYEARILRVGGKVQLLKVEEARDVAPAATGTGEK